MKRLALFLLIALSSCQYDGVSTDACGVKDPANELPWLKDMIQQMDKSSIRQYFRIELVDYNGELGFYAPNCCPMCNTALVFYKCSGESVWDVDASKITFKGVIWQPANYSCQMH